MVFKLNKIDPSFMGRIDPLVCGSSDPGTSLQISPWCELDGFEFNNSVEGDQFMYEFRQDLLDKEWEKNNTDYDYLRFSPKNKEDFFKSLGKLEDLSHNVVAFGDSPENPGIVVEDSEDIDEKEN